MTDGQQLSFASDLPSGQTHVYTWDYGTEFVQAEGTVYTDVNFSVSDATTTNRANAAIYVWDTSKISNTGPQSVRGTIDVGNGWLIKAENSGHSTFQIRITGAANRQATYVGSSYSVLDQAGAVADGPFIGAVRRLSFLGPMDFDTVPLVLGADSYPTGNGVATTAAFVNAGHVSPGEDGFPLGAIEVAGNYSQNGGDLAIELDDEGHDLLTVSGAPNLISLAGSLGLTAVWDTPPAVGGRVPIVRNDTDQDVSGIFAGYPDGYQFWLGGAYLRITYGRTAPYADPNDVILDVITPPTYIWGTLFNDGAVYYTGQVWDRDGRADTGFTNGFAYVTVELRDPAGTVVATTTTDWTGYYIFNDIGFGSFTVRFDTPPLYPGAYLGYHSTTKDVGDDFYDSDVDESGVTDPIGLGPTNLYGNNVNAGVWLEYRHSRPPSRPGEGGRNPSPPGPDHVPHLRCVQPRHRAPPGFHRYSCRRHARRSPGASAAAA